MVERLEIWKRPLERLRSQPAIQWGEAARLVADIARLTGDATLRHAAEQATPILRQAVQNSDDTAVAEAARRRLGMVLDVLHELVLPRFGRRDAKPKPASAEERARRTLGLPVGVQLTCDDIQRAFRSAAKTLHPDAGGTEQAFLELSNARDILIHPGAHKNAS